VVRISKDGGCRQGYKRSSVFVRKRSTHLIGYLASPVVASSLRTDKTASTASVEKKDAFWDPIIFDDMAVDAADTRNSLSIFSVETVK